MPGNSELHRGTEVFEGVGAFFETVRLWDRCGGAYSGVVAVWREQDDRGNLPWLCVTVISRLESLQEFLRIFILDRNSSW
jgi:hypothetical protein